MDEAGGADAAGGAGGADAARRADAAGAAGGPDGSGGSDGSDGPAGCGAPGECRGPGRRGVPGERAEAGGIAEAGVSAQADGSGGGAAGVGGRRGGMEAVADRFERHRARLRAVAFRMLGSVPEAEDAVQETWLRLSRVEADGIANLAGWLTTVVSRICLDMLRTGRTRPEEPLGHEAPQDGERAGAGDGAAVAGWSGAGGAPEDEAVLIDSVGRALLVVLETLSPAERVAFVLHDLFAVPFDEIAAILGRSRPAAKKLASRARQRVRGTPAVPAARLARHRHVVAAFLAAARDGDIPALLAVLAPQVVRQADPAGLPAGAPARTEGAEAVARETALLAANARAAALALVDGDVGIVVAPHGRLRLVLTLTVTDDRISAYTVHADPSRLRGLRLAALDV